VQADEARESAWDKRLGEFSICETRKGEEKKRVGGGERHLNEEENGPALIFPSGGHEEDVELKQEAKTSHSLHSAGEEWLESH